jgi:hypothetical protein
MGSVTSPTKAGAAGPPAAPLRSDQRKTARPSSDGSDTPPEGSICLAAALGSIMLSLDADRTWTHRSGG